MKCSDPLDGSDIFAVVNRRNAIQRQKYMVAMIDELIKGLTEVNEWLTKKNLSLEEYDLYVIRNMEGIAEMVDKLLTPTAYLKRNRALYAENTLVNMFNKLEKSC